MKKFLLMSAMSAVMIFSSCGGSSKSNEDAKDSNHTEEVKDSKVLVAYYSATGTTAKAAGELANATGGTLYEITPETPYTDEDLDYENEKSRSAVENKNPDMRPAIKTGLDISPYETVYVGFPVWWDKAPLVVYTFLDSYDFSGKKIVVFATAHSSGLTPSFEALKAAYPKYDFTEGKILNNTSGDSFNEWVKSLSK
ncbi:MAG: flavodoxin [Muribaculaceae bacterium]|nr:flavodoxin [Muribaculaceae bacterium]